MDGSGDATELLGMGDFVVLASSLEDGERYVLVETRCRVVGCPTCGVIAVGHGRSVVQVRDLPMSGVAVRLVWRKRLLEAGLTTRAAKEICRRVGEDGHSVAQVARDFGVGWGAAMEAVRRHGEPLVEDPARLEAVVSLGVDEHKMLSATRRHHTFYATSFEVRERTASRPSSRRRHRRPLPRREARQRGDQRRAPPRAERDARPRRGHRDDPLYRTRRLMTRGWERLAPHQRDRLFAALRAGDPDGEVAATILGKELLREVYAAGTLASARRRLDAFYDHVAWAEVRELTRLGKTVRAWETEILNFHVTGASNGTTEAQNLITEKIRRIGHGFRNFQNYRLRLLLHSGVQWNTRPTARIRGRHPRLIA